VLFCTGIVVGAVLGGEGRVDIAASTMVEVVSDSAIPLNGGVKWLSLSGCRYDCSPADGPGLPGFHGALLRIEIAEQIL
jgi:hypothetical protein